MRLANPNNPSGASIEVQYFWQHDGGASAETVTSWGMVETQLTDIETKPGRAPYIEWKDGGKSDVEKRESGFAYLIFTDFAIVPIETTGEAKGKDGAGYLTPLKLPSPAENEELIVDATARAIKAWAKLGRPLPHDSYEAAQAGTGHSQYKMSAMRMPQPSQGDTMGNAAGGGEITVTTQIDNGADCSVTSDLRLKERAIKQRSETYSITGIPGSKQSKTSQLITILIKHPEDRSCEPVELELIYIKALNDEPPSTVIAQGMLEQAVYDVTITKKMLPGSTIVWRGNLTQPIRKVESGFSYLCWADFGVASKARMSAAQAKIAVLPSANHPAILQAARWNLSAEGLEALVKVTGGIDIGCKKIPKDIASAIAKDEGRLKALEKRKPARKAVAIKDKVHKAGHTFQMDYIPGPNGVTCKLTSSVGDVWLMDACSSYIHCEMVKSKSAKSLLGVIKTVLAKERAIGHEVAIRA